MGQGYRHPHLPSTEAAATAIRDIAREYNRSVTVTDDIGADQTSRRITAGALGITDPDGSLPHEAYLELAGSPEVTVQLFPEDDATITVDGVEFPDLPRDAVPAFLRSIYSGLAFVEAKTFPPAMWLTVPLPGDETYKELIVRTTLTPWLSRNAR
ncbi:MAG TPA: hypothetical protein VGZ32_16280 [Actinocrinis sp.]|jgi:hypothetical protein|uniref:hypothetical protein n=1 Tax=Actinocrinis sp. TaxID=1920516 RepID=UPI002DDCC0D3|nr:hypothetical protein [Actinocrinis sp.]HEV3171910.1 hypothetical protein [Actinocrinis sp.]